MIGKIKTLSKYLPRRLIINENELDNKKLIAESFNDFFVTIGPKLADSIPTTTKNFKMFVDKTNNIMPEYELTDEEFQKAFCSLKSNESPGYDSVSSNVINNFFQYISSPLKHIFHLSIKKGVFPDAVKIARVSPIFKTGETYFLTNYRTISVLPCFSKILERIIYNRVVIHLEQNRLLYLKQFGFQKLHSTEHAILQPAHQITSSFEQNKFRLGVFTDLSKAFDRADHTILLAI